MKAICVFSGKIHGIIHFEQKTLTDSVNISLDLRGFKKKQTHAIHIHEFGNLSEGCMSTGSHFNPFGYLHGLLHEKHHAGDIMSNIVPNKKGIVKMHCQDESISLYPTEKNCIIGRSIVIHEFPDDLGDASQYDKMSPKDLLEFVWKRKYIHKKKDFKYEKMKEYCKEQSRLTGNAGGRMTCAIIGFNG
jgi:Cu-Zn family superoxide dismutase